MANPFTPENKTGFVANSVRRTPAIPNKAGFFKDAAGEMARGVLDLENSFAGLIEGGARALGFDEFAANQAQGRKNTFEQWDKDLTDEGIVHQTMLEGEDSLLNRYKRGEDWLQYAPEAVTDLVFQQLPQLAFGGVAGKLGAAGGAAMKVAPKLGAIGGMFAGTAAQETGSIYNEQKEGEKDFGKAVATGVPAGLLETAGTMFGLKKSGLGKYIAEGLEEAPVKNWAGVGINLLKGGLGEAATEGSQNVLEQIGRQPGWDIPKDISNVKPMEVAENMLGGLIMGGGMSGLGSAVEMKQNAYMDARNKAQQDIANGEAAAQGVSDKFAADVSTGVQSASLIDGAETIDEQVRKQRDITKQETIAGDTLAAVDQTHEELENFNTGIDELSKPSYLMPNGQPAYAGSLESEITGVNKAKTKLFSNHLGFAEKDLGITGLQIVDVKGDQSEVLQRIAQALGRKVHYYVHENLQGETTAPEGFTNRNDPSRIFINARGNNSPIFIFGHEVAHTLASEMGGSSFERLVRELETGFDVEKYNNIIADAKQQKELAGLTDDGIKEEFIGNLFGEFLTKPHNLEALAAYNPTLFQKIADIAIKVINKIKKAIGSLKGQYPTAASFVDDIGHVEAVIASVLNAQATIASEEGYKAKPYGKEDKLSYMNPVEDSSRRLEKFEGWLIENGVNDADINTDAVELMGKGYDELTEQEKHQLLDGLPDIYRESNPHIARNEMFDLMDEAESDIEGDSLSQKTLKGLKKYHSTASDVKNDEGMSDKDNLSDLITKYENAMQEYTDYKKQQNEEILASIAEQEKPATSQTDAPQTFSGKMTYDANTTGHEFAGENKRAEVKSTSTADAIRNGERTATTRYESQGKLDYWKQVKAGDIINFVDNKGKTVKVRVTRPLFKLKGSGENPLSWSKKEGWSVSYFNKNVKPKLDEAWQLEYEYVGDSTETKPITASSEQEPIPSQGVEDKKPSSSATEAPAAKPSANPLADITTKAKTEVHNKVYWKKVFGEIVPFEKFDEFAQYMKFDSFAELQAEYPKGMKIPYQDSVNFKEDAKSFMAAQKNYTRKRNYDADGNLLKDEYVETTPVKSKTAEERKVNKILDDLTKLSVADIDTDPFEAARERRDLKAYGTKRQQEDELSDSEYADTAVADTVGLLVKQMAEANDWDLGPSKQKSKRSIPQMDYIPKQIEKRNEVFRKRNTQSLEKIIGGRRGKTTLADEIKNARNKTIVNKTKVQDKTVIPERQKKDDVEKFKTIEDMINGIRGDWSTLEGKRKSAEASFKRENEASIKMAKNQIEESDLLDAKMYSGEGAEYVKGVKEDLLDMIDTIDKSGMYFPDVYKAVLKEQDIDLFSELIEMPQAMYRAFDQINNLSDIEEDVFTEEEAAKRKQEVSEKNKEQGIYYSKSKDTPVLKRQPVRQATDEEKEKIKAAAKNYVSSTTMKSKPVYEQWKASNATPEALKKIGKAIIEYVEENRFDGQMTHYATDMIKDISAKIGVSQRDVSNALRLMTVRVKDALAIDGEIKEDAEYRTSNTVEKLRWPLAIDNQDQFSPAQDKYHDLVRVLDLINGFGRQKIVEAVFYDGEGGTYKKEISVSFAQRNANRRLERKDSSPQKGDIVRVKIPDEMKQAEVFASEMFGDYKQVNKLIDAATENEVNGKPAPLAQEDTEALKSIMQEIDTVKAELANSSSEITRLKKEQEAIVKKAKADANGAAVKMPTEFYNNKKALNKVEALPKTTREKIAELEALAKEHIIAIKTALFEQQVDKMQGVTPEFIEETAAKTGLTEQEVFELAHAANYNADVMTLQVNRAVSIKRQEKFDKSQEALNALMKKNGTATQEEIEGILERNDITIQELFNIGNKKYLVKETKRNNKMTFSFMDFEDTYYGNVDTDVISQASFTYDQLMSKLGKIAEANHQAIQKGTAQKEQASDAKKVFGKLTVPEKVTNTDETTDTSDIEFIYRDRYGKTVQVRKRSGFEKAKHITNFNEIIFDTLVSLDAKKPLPILPENYDALQEGFIPVSAMTSLATEKRAMGLSVAPQDLFIADDVQPENKPLLNPGYESTGNYMVGRLRSGFAQSVFTKIANAFEADLVVVRDFSGHFNGMYIPKGKNGRAKLVINVDSKTSFTHLFAHELFHHVMNKITASAANILQAAIDKSVDKELYDKALKTVAYKYTNLGFIENADKASMQEEVNAEIFATAFKQPEFWNELSKTEEGISVARRLIFRGLKNITSVMKVLNSLGRGEQSIFEIDKLVKEWYGKDGVYQAIAKVVNEALDSNSPLRHLNTKYSAFEHGKVAANEAKEAATSIWEKIAAFFRRIFPKGTKSYKEVMQNIEDIAGEAKNWIIKHKPKGIYEDLGADPMDMFLVGKVAFDPAWDVKKAEAAVAKHKEVWKGMTDIQLEKLHDAVVRKKDVTGLTDEQKAAFDAYKEIADSIWERLSKIYPDLKKRESHYGQSIKWLFNNGIAMEKDINEEASRLLGNDRFTKEKAENKTTRQIAEEMNLKYETINPHELLMNYVYDSAKLIGLHEMLQEGMAQKKVFFLDDNDAAAKRKGLRPVSDAAMKVMKDMTVSEGYTLQKNGKDIVDDDSLETLEFDSLEDAQKHLEENPIEEARVVAKTSSKSVVDGKYYFTDRLGAMLETLVARDAVRNFEAFGYSGHQVMNLKNKMTAVEMALSLFHAVTIGHEFNSSTFANQLQQGGSLLDKAKGLNIFTNLNAARQASKLMNMLADPDSNKEELKEKLKKLLRTDSDEVLNVLEYYYRSGGEQGMDKDFQTSTHKKAKMKYGSWDEMKGSVKEVWDKEIANNPDKRFKAMFNTAEFAALEAPTAWLMEDGIPMLKLSLFGTEFVFEVGKKEKTLGRKLTDQEKQKVAWDVMSFVGDRMGEVNWKTQFMLPSVKTALQFAMRSYTWASGNIIALGKSGHAFTEYGWAKLKGDKDAKLSPYGYWGISAIFNHFLAASLITASYTLSRLALGYEEAPDDPETSLLTKAIFPRISAHDPTKRLAIPSYVTESYKILSHLGLTGHKAEPFKLISGRFNSLVSNLVDVLKNENWRGVNIRDKDENIVKQLADVAAHMMVVPISFSTIAKEYKETGELARPIATGIMGMTSAPASAIRSKATQRAFELRRSENKGRETTEEQFEETQAQKRAMYAYAQGDSSKIDQLKKEGRISQRQYDIAITRIPLIKGKPNPKYIDQLSQAIKGLTINGALESWELMSDAEQTKHRGEIKKKYFNMLSRKDKPEAEKTKIKEKMKELNLI